MQVLKLKQNIWKFYVHQALRACFFVLPVVVLFWQDNGLSLSEVMLLQSIFAIMIVALEIPSGYFADIYGRKRALIISSLCGFIAIIIFALGQNFWQFLIAEIFFALDVSFSSGTKSAFVYDTLKELGREKQYKKIWGDMFFYSLLSLALAGIIGSLLGAINLRYAVYASIPFFAFMIPLACSMQETQTHKAIIAKNYSKDLLHILKYSLIKNHKLRWLIIYSGVIYAFNQAALWLYQPYFKLSGIQIAYFGLVFASFQIVAAISSKYAHQLEEKLGQNHSLALLVFLLAGSYFLMSNFIFLFSFSFCFIQQFVRSFKRTIVTDYINQITSSNSRATILSAESFVGRIIYATILPILGLVVDAYTLKTALTLIGISTLLVGCTSLLLLWKAKAR